MPLENFNLLPEQKQKEFRKIAEEMANEFNNNELIKVDTDKFWEENEISIKDAFNPKIPQLPLGIGMSYECIFEELGIEEDHWKYMTDKEFRSMTTKEYNERAKKIVGRELVDENNFNTENQYPETKKLNDVFEAKNEWHGISWWLMQSANNEKELESLLDRVEKKIENLKEFVFPAGWEEEKSRLLKKGIKPPVYRFQRGPVTFATSIYGIENFIYLLYDNPELAERLRDLILRSMLELGKVYDEDCGFTEKNFARGFQFNDDNCALLTKDFYEFFAYPILKTVFDKYCPDPVDRRYQHSDSKMEHILPVLAKLNFTGVNFGPTLSVGAIRKYCKNAVIEGQLAPFTFSRNELENIVLETLRDFEFSKEHRGVLFSTAGSINNGSRLTSLRLIMAAIQRHCRY